MSGYSINTCSTKKTEPIENERVVAGITPTTGATRLRAASAVGTGVRTDAVAAVAAVKAAIATGATAVNVAAEVAVASGSGAVAVASIANSGRLSAAATVIKRVPS